MAERSRFDTVITEKRDGVQWISLNRPHRLNAFNLELVGELSTVIDELEADREVRCVVLRGEGDRAFSVGADLTMFTDLDPPTAVATAEEGQADG